ncbi:DNA-binding response regulator [Pseudomonas abyssi]|uniref:DNA-binding response regulator n=1 Tax=Pseudomonas abyssi TaxID=170540 RepID=A0A2A3MH97_9PSED|nr:DNA-binding response regulator [Pseudomonadales bacterium]PBK04152.1 DNA-binding response regulator [Pseudomonas abyssi]|tara:strand:- start:1650 stop:2405 length:756 start_codon:yes stop_codon:yes gene_type:complete
MQYVCGRLWFSFLVRRVQVFQARILAVEDDPVLGEHLLQSLGNSGHDVVLATDGQQGLAQASQGAFDLILLDVMLPGLSGMELISRLRRLCVTPVLMMSALGDEESRVTGFDRGADDYLPKPFSSRELEVRVNAILRRISYERGQGVAQPAVDDAELHFDEKASRLRYGDIAVIFTPTEYRLLEVLHAHAGEVQSKAFLYQQVLHRGFTRHDRVLDMHVSNLRRKLSQAGIDCLRLEAVWGHGYLLSRDPC